jgi:hypothetical protein
MAPPDCAAHDLRWRPLGRDYIGVSLRTLKPWSVMAPWGVVLAIDFAISFSHTIAPRKRRGT